MHILYKGTTVRDQEELSHSYYKEASQPSALNKIFTEITCYRGSVKNPQWTDEEPGKQFLHVDSPPRLIVMIVLLLDYFSTLCTIQADTSRVTKRQQTGSNGKFYQQDFRVVLSCGQTELTAQISWMENVSIAQFPLIDA